MRVGAFSDELKNEGKLPVEIHEAKASYDIRTYARRYVGRNKCPRVQITHYLLQIVGVVVALNV